MTKHELNALREWLADKIASGLSDVEIAHLLSNTDKTTLVEVIRDLMANPVKE